MGTWLGRQLLQERLDAGSGQGKQALDGLSSSRDRLADSDEDLLAYPELTASRQADGDDRHLVIDGEMCESLAEGEERAFLSPVLTFRIECDRTAPVQAAVDVLKQLVISLACSIDGYESARLADRPPLQAPCGETAGVAQKVDARFGGKGAQYQERVEPAKVVGDDDVGAVPRNFFAALIPDAKQEVEERDAGQAGDAEGGGGCSLYGKEVGRDATGRRRPAPRGFQAPCPRPAPGPRGRSPACLRP